MGVKGEETKIFKGDVGFFFPEALFVLRDFIFTLMPAETRRRRGKRTGRGKAQKRRKESATEKEESDGAYKTPRRFLKAGGAERRESDQRDCSL